MLQFLKKVNLKCLDAILRKLEENKYILYYQEYITLGEEIHASLPFKIYYTLKNGSVTSPGLQLHRWGNATCRIPYLVHLALIYDSSNLKQLGYATQRYLRKNIHIHINIEWLFYIYITYYCGNNSKPTHAAYTTYTCNTHQLQHMYHYTTCK
jgi:hypothetical protein